MAETARRVMRIVEKRGLEGGDDPMAASRSLACIGLPQRAPPLAPARTPGDPSEPWLEDPATDDFDQTPPETWDPVA